MHSSLLVDQVRRQLNFIITSCQAYDAGLRVEAVRIASAARVLFHDTGHSRSLLRGHLGLQSLRLRSTAVPLDGPGSQFIGFIGFEPDTSSFRHFGDDVPNDKQTDIETWWACEPILKLPTTNELITRKQLILSAANTDGGAHVDQKRAREYERLEAGLSIKLVMGCRDGSQRTISLRFANLAALRQIGHEILTSKELTEIAESPVISPWTD